MCSGKVKLIILRLSSTELQEFTWSKLLLVISCAGSLAQISSTVDAGHDLVSSSRIDKPFSPYHIGLVDGKVFQDVELWEREAIDTELKIARF